MPAMNAPSSESTPNSWASAVKTSSTTNAPRTRSWVVSSSESANVRAIHLVRHSALSATPSSTAATPMAATYST